MTRVPDDLKVFISILLKNGFLVQMSQDVNPVIFCQALSEGETLKPGVEREMLGNTLFSNMKHRSAPYIFFPAEVTAPTNW